MPNSKRWSDPTELGGWQRRARIAATYLDGIVLDLGCGDMSLEKWLKTGTQYVPVDFIKRDARCLVCDFDKDELPSGNATVAVALGVLEYVREKEFFSANLEKLGIPILLSYHFNATSADWEPILTVNDFLRLFYRFRIQMIPFGEDETFVWLKPEC
jgi:hypothetical protein